MIQQLIEYLLKNIGSVPGVIALVGIGIYIYFDLKYKSALEGNHFKSIGEKMLFLDGKITSFHARLDTIEKDDIKQGERIARIETSIEYIDKKLDKINGFKGI